TAAAEARLIGYEEGYQAGWEDAISAEGEDQERLTQEVAEALSRLNQQVGDLQEGILRALSPLLLALAAKLLPLTARAALAPLILELIAPHFDAQAKQPARLWLNPKDAEALAKITELADL